MYHHLENGAISRARPTMILFDFQVVLSLLAFDRRLTLGLWFIHEYIHKYVVEEFCFKDFQMYHMIFTTTMNNFPKQRTSWCLKTNSCYPNMAHKMLNINHHLSSYQQTTTHKVKSNPSTRENHISLTLGYVHHGSQPESTNPTARNSKKTTPSFFLLI